MNPVLLEQRKEALHYNQQKNSLMRSLCEPLERYLSVEWFTHAVLVLNPQEKCVGYRILTTDTDFFKSYIFQFNDNGESFIQAVKETPLHSYSYFLWSSSDGCALIQLLSQQFSIIKGLVIYKRCKGYIQAWSFGSQNLKGIPNIITQESVAPFLNFISYFEEKQSLSHLLNLIPFVKYFRPFDMSYTDPHKGQIEHFKSCVSSNRFTLNIGEKFILLTKREWECLSGMAQGKTYKGVASILSLSPRTVETYLNQIREKTGVTSKSKLIDCFIEQNKSFLG